MSAVRVRLSPARELSGYYDSDSTEFCQFGSSIYDFTFMDVDKILPFSSTLGWHSLNVNGEVQKRKGLCCVNSLKIASTEEGLFAFSERGTVNSFLYICFTFRWNIPLNT